MRAEPVLLPMGADCDSPAGSPNSKRGCTHAQYCLLRVRSKARSRSSHPITGQREAPKLPIISIIATAIKPHPSFGDDSRSHQDGSVVDATLGDEIDYIV